MNFIKLYIQSTKKENKNGYTKMPSRRRGAATMTMPYVLARQQRAREAREARKRRKVYKFFERAPSIWRTKQKRKQRQFARKVGKNWRKIQTGQMQPPTI